MTEPGLHRVSTPDLVALRSVVERGEARCPLFLDIRQRAPTAGALDAHVRSYIQRFLGMNWPFGPPFPSIHWDPRTAEPGFNASLHAKCIIVDDKRTLITSANFTDRGQTRNLELGVLVEDKAFGETCAGQWRRLIAEGLVRRYVRALARSSSSPKKTDLASSTAPA